MSNPTHTGPQAQEAGSDPDALTIARNYLADVEELNITESMRDKWEGFAILESLVQYAGTKTPARVVSDSDVERALSAEVGGEIVLSFLTTQDGVTAEQIIRAALSTLQSGAEGKDGECSWRQQDHGGECVSTGCGSEYRLDEFEQGSMIYCCFCGDKMKLVTWTQDDTDEEEE